MTKKEKNNLLLIGAAAVAIWFLMKKKKPMAARMLNTEQAQEITAGQNMQRAVDNTKFIEASESEAKQYKKDINQCAI